ncbi:MAG: glutathione S-transferase family protein [Pseudomonadota bacterium]
MQSTPKLTLVTLGAAFGLQNVSPFCLKIEMLMAALELDFDVQVESDPRKAPKGKLPYLMVDGEQLPDSELIVEYLDTLTQGAVYAGIEASDRALGTALVRLVEDHLYWILVASRWLEDDWFGNVVEGFFHIAPKPLRGIVAGMARKQVRQTYHLHGLGRHSRSEQEGFARRDLQALQDAVADRPFICGATPRVFDFAVAGFMAGLYDQQPPTWLTPVANDYPGLRDYTERVQASVGVYGRPVEQPAA